MKAHTAQIRYQNPEAQVTCRVERNEDKAMVRIHIKDGPRHELDVTNMHQHEILRRVLETAGVDKDLVEEAVRIRLEQIEAEMPNKPATSEIDAGTEENAAEVGRENA